jgi:hypothetical protein
MSCCPKVGTLEWALAGAAGLLNAASRRHRAEEEVIQARRDVCRACPDRTSSARLATRPSQGMTTLSVCKVCLCNIAAKTSLKDATCCAGKW